MFEVHNRCIALILCGVLMLSWIRTNTHSTVHTHTSLISLSLCNLFTLFYHMARTTTSTCWGFPFSFVRCLSVYFLSEQWTKYGWNSVYILFVWTCEYTTDPLNKRVAFRGCDLLSQIIRECGFPKTMCSLDFFI